MNSGSRPRGWSYPGIVGSEIDAADWSLRSAEFGALAIVELSASKIVPGMTLGPPPEGIEGWVPLRRAWFALTPHPHMLEVIANDFPTLRYAAIDWKAKATPGDEFANAIKVARVFAHVAKHVEQVDWVWFQEPRVSFDLRGEPRVWWQAVAIDSDTIAPEAKKEWLDPTEKLLVYALGRALTDVGLTDHPTGTQIVKRCLARPILRMRTIEDVVRTLEMHLRTELPARDQAWDLTELGVGWLAVDRLDEARACFEAALKVKPSYAMAKAGGERATTPSEPADLERARRLEEERWWSDAIVEYRRCRPLMTSLDYHQSLARCAAGMGNWRYAYELASRAVLVAPGDVGVLQMLVAASIGINQLADAVFACEKLVAIAPGEALGPIVDTLVAADKARLGNLQRSCVAALNKSLSVTDPPSAAPLLERLVRQSRASDDVVAICGRLLGMSSEHGTRAALHLLPRIEPKTVDMQAVCALLVALPDSFRAAAATGIVQRLDPQNIKQARETCDVLLTLPPENGTKLVLELIKRVAGSSVDDALELCERVHAIGVDRAIEAFSVTAEVAFQRGEIAAAMALADSMIARFPKSGLGLYRRGRCLFSLGRLVEARDALDRAQVIEPKLVDAMLLRREVDRALGKVKAVVGSALPQQLAIPEHLPEVRAAMARGSIPDAVSWLESHQIGDGAARLLLGNLLIGQERFVDAVRAFEQVAGALVTDANVGKARALAALGRGEEALRLLDRVVAEDPESTEAMVVRAKVVAMLR